LPDAGDQSRVRRDSADELVSGQERGVVLAGVCAAGGGDVGGAEVANPAGLKYLLEGRANG
jgi:hypothetical protein